MPKVAAKKGQLSEIARSVDMTISTVAFAADLSIRTMRTIERGYPVTLETLQRTAQALGRPLEYLIDDTTHWTEADIDQPIHKQNSLEPDTDDSERIVSRLLKSNEDVIMLDEADRTGYQQLFADKADPDWLAQHLRKFAKHRFKVKIPASEISTVIDAELRLFGELVAEYRSGNIRNKPKVEDEEDLSALLDEIKANNALADSIENLEAHAISIFIAAYDFWEMTDQFYNRHEVYYESVPILVFVITNQKYLKNRPIVGVDCGSFPPKSPDECENGPVVFINNRLFSKI